MEQQLNQEENNTLTHEDILEVFENLIKYLKLAKMNLSKNPEKILEEIEKLNLDITIKEIENSLNIILNKTNKWFNLYKNTKDILQVPLKEYDLVSSEASRLLEYFATIYDLLYVEIIDFQIGCIGGIICKEMKKIAHLNSK